MPLNPTRPKHSGAGAATTLDVLKAFWRGMRSYKLSLFIIVSGVVLARIVDIIVPIFYKRFFDVINVSSMSISAKAQELLHIIIIIFVLNLFIWIGYRLVNFASSHFQAMVMARLKQQAFDYMIEHSYAFYTNNFTGSLVQRVNRFARAFEKLSDRVTYEVLSLAIQITGICVVLWFVNPL
ncbi:MAG: ABC transporter transmembrane domain-containing protein, partial [bacterium]|nr:ABC transporter transmembrane domain-containing protein [bacterium]